MEISDKLVDHLSNLAKLEFNASEKEAIKNDLSKMTDFMEKMDEVNTEDVAPLLFMTHEINVLREDEPKVTITKEEALKNAPQKDSDYFRVPKVLQGK